MIEVKEKNGVLIASFTDEDRFNALITEPVKEKLLEYYSKPNTRLAVNLHGIKFIDSSGFSVFLTLMKAANNNYGELKICNVNPEVKELFQVLQLHNIFEIYDTLDDCIASFN
ncbi:MAG: STAS domain-containing protein [Bacteroidales bacterium]